MKKRSLLFGLISAAVIFSCDDEKPEAGVEFLKANVADLPDGTVDLWAFATNEKGQILDVVQYREGVTFSLKTDLDFSRIDLTLLNVVEHQLGKNFQLSTYKDIPAGETLELGNLPGEPFESSFEGNAQVTITNYSEQLTAAANLRFSQVPGGPLPTVLSTSGTTHNFAVALRRSPTNLVIHGLREKLPAYKVLPNLKANDQVVVDFQTFQEYENLVEIKGFQGFTFVQGIPGTDLSEAQEILLTETFLNQDALYLGTIPGYARYTTRVFSYADGRDYFRVGPALTSFAFPEYSTTITDHSLENFQIEISIDYDYKTVTWRNASTIFWNVLADKANSLAPPMNIPGQIANLYPELRSKEFGHDRVVFYHSKGSFSYQDLLASTFRREQKLEYEQYTLLSK